MSNQAKLRKMLEMLLLLSGNRLYSVRDLADKYSTSERTIYRYIDTFKEAGLVFDGHDGVFHIDKYNSEFKEISELLHFNEEEAYILSKAIHAIDDTNLIKSNLIKKLYSLYDFNRVADTVVKKEYSENVHKVLDAIKQKRQVRLVAYRSASSESITDRLVEPFDFSTNYISIWCYELASGMNKMFKTSRIGEVQITDIPWRHQHLHSKGFVDVFRISSNQQTHVKLALTMRAKSLLEEEYPLSERHISLLPDGRYLFEAPVCAFDGVGRFIMGLCNEVEVLKPMELKQFVRERMAEAIG
ncbi:MAG: WYL domain-containing protein [Breznakibacter sp.]